MNLLGAQVREMKSMSNSIRKLEGYLEFPYSKLLTVVIIARKNWLYIVACLNCVVILNIIYHGCICGLIKSCHKRP